VIYYDGQFDDSRLLIHLAATAAEQGAVLPNYAQVTALTRCEDDQRREIQDAESGRMASASARGGQCGGPSAMGSGSWPNRPAAR
jgi:glycerol-3-phosphate dehydrogenase